MTSGDTGGNIRTVARAWEGMACGGGEVRCKLLDRRAEVGAKIFIVPREEGSSRAPGDLSRPCRGDVVATSERLQQWVFDCVCPATRTPWKCSENVPCDPARGGA